MNESSANVVGVEPWLPWPLSAWPAWTDPVRAERLALLRIGVALCLIADICIHYAPYTLEYFGKGRLGDPGIFDWRFKEPRMTWSLLRGFGDSATMYLAMTLWIAMTVWIVGTSLARLLFIHKNPPADDRSGMAVCLWMLGFVVYIMGLWSELTAAGAKIDFVAWLMPLAGFSCVCLFWVLELATRLRDESHRIAWLTLALAINATIILVALGFGLTLLEGIDQEAWWLRILRPWQDHDGIVIAVMIVWIGSAVCMLFGAFTRLAAVMTWAISISFANANPYLDNAGDSIRLILLFYLMLCPCGAVWSLDGLVKKRPRPVYVHPWPIRLIFTQMIVMYFINGLYKLFGESWLNGESLHYVLGDLVLARVSFSLLPLPFEVTRIMTWTVLTWEVSFPLLVIFKWPRRLALFFGVVFHLGIFVSMELGPFPLYALCMYLPLIPWSREGQAKS
jgi:Vitamin K-dependent gamma-carboxylase